MKDAQGIFCVADGLGYLGRDFDRKSVVDLPGAATWGERRMQQPPALEVSR
jgi:hypothetical protein